MSKQRHLVLTVGHSTHPFDRFVTLLSQHGVTTVADVRSAPFSRFNPQFNKNALEQNLKAQGIRYVFLGRELGARSDDRSCFEKGRVQYAKLARTEMFRSGIERVIRGAEAQQIALLCAEKDPLECHRTLLVARALNDQGMGVAHILGDGRLESHADAIDRLLDLTGQHNDLFRSREELIAEALARQEDKIAYVNEKLAGQAS